MAARVPTIRYSRIVPPKRSSGKFTDAIERAMAGCRLAVDRASTTEVSASRPAKEMADQQADHHERQQRNHGSVADRSPQGAPHPGEQNESGERQEHVRRTADEGSKAFGSAGQPRSHGNARHQRQEDGDEHDPGDGA